MHADDVDDEDDADASWWSDWRRLAEQQYRGRPQRMRRDPLEADPSHLSRKRWFSDQLLLPGECVANSSWEVLTPTILEAGPSLSGHWLINLTACISIPDQDAIRLTPVSTQASERAKRAHSLSKIKGSCAARY
jgi:hypothetical protein